MEYTSLCSDNSTLGLLKFLTLHYYQRNKQYPSPHPALLLLLIENIRHLKVQVGDTHAPPVSMLQRAPLSFKIFVLWELGEKKDFLQRFSFFCSPPPNPVKSRFLFFCFFFFGSWSAVTFKPFVSGIKGLLFANRNHDMHPCDEIRILKMKVQIQHYFTSCPN